MRAMGHEMFEDRPQATKTKRVPKGTSQYQAAWIVDSEDEDYSEDDEDEDGDMDMVQEDEEDVVPAAATEFPRDDEESEQLELERRQEYQDELTAEEERQA